MARITQIGVERRVGFKGMMELDVLRCLMDENKIDI
jgi:hypothetical protein